MFTGRLYKAVYDHENLNKAWNRVRTNKGVCGVDEMNVVRFNAMLFSGLMRLRDQLRKRSYQPKPIRRFNMKKSDGKNRPIGVLTVEDRIVQRAVLQVIEPLFDRHFSSSNFGYRKGLSTKDAIEQVVRNFNRNYQWVLDADVLEFFQNIDHRILIKKIRKVVSDSDILKLVEKWLDLGIMGFRSNSPVAGRPPKVGILQGSPLSPLFANIYLDPLDKALLKKGFKLVRFGDDFIVQCATRKEAEFALKYLLRLLENLKLELHPYKTQLTHFDKGVKFLGNMLRSSFSSNGKTLRATSIKSQNNCKEARHVRALYDPSRVHFKNYGREIPGYAGAEETSGNTRNQG